MATVSAARTASRCRRLANGRTAAANLNPEKTKIMNPQIKTLDPVMSSIITKSILAQDGFECAITTLAPGDETPLREAHNVETHLLFVLDGEVTVRFGEINTVLKKDEALLVSKGQAHLITAGATGWAKLLRVDVPPREVVTPQILTVGN